MRSVWVGKRQANRAACLIRAHLRLEDGSDLVDCQIVDLSATGARIRLDQAIDVPSLVSLFIPARSETRSCKLQWHRETQIGVEFVKMETATSEGLIGLAARLAKLETMISAGGHNPSVHELAQRMTRIEDDLARITARLEVQDEAGSQGDLLNRLNSLEATSLEIHTILRGLLPALMRRAS